MRVNEAAWIRTIAPSEATTSLKSVYDAISPTGNVAHILQVQALDPVALASHYALYRHIMFAPSPLSRSEREMIAVSVSRTNHCEY